MHDPRIDQLANVLLDHSCKLQKGEKVLIEAIDLPEPNLVCSLVEGAAKRGALPVVTWKNLNVQRSLYMTATAESMRCTPGQRVHISVLNCTRVAASPRGPDSSTRGSIVSPESTVRARPCPRRHTRPSTTVAASRAATITRARARSTVANASRRIRRRGR